jgi:hypothetical protein
MKNLRIACSALSSRIMAGKVCKDGMTFKEGAVDVTSDVLKAVIEKIESDSPKTNTIIITRDGKPEYEVSVKRL